MNKSTSKTLESVVTDKLSIIFNLRDCHGIPSNFSVPVPVIVELGNFRLDKRTGNMIINFKDGRILGYRSEDVVSL